MRGLPLTGPLVAVGVGSLCSAFSGPVGSFSPGPNRRVAADSFEGNGFLATFAAGLFVGTRSRDVAAALFRFGDAEGKLLTLATFALFGLLFAIPAVTEASPRTWLAAFVTLTVVRIVPVVIAPGAMA